MAKREGRLKPKTELNSWKEIAERLDVSVRTAQLWELRRGLPVRRLPGGPGRVFVRVDELEAWMFGGGPTFAAANRAPTVRPRTVLALWVSGLVLSLTSWAGLR